MAIVYSEQFETRKATTNVAGTTTANYRIEHIVRNPVGGAVKTVTSTISQVTVEGEGEAQTEKLTRVGNACVDVDNNRNYLAIERHAEVTADNQAAIAAQYFSDIKSILTPAE